MRGRLYRVHEVKRHLQDDQKEMYYIFANKRMYHEMFP